MLLVDSEVTVPWGQTFIPLSLLPGTPPHFTTFELYVLFSPCSFLLKVVCEVGIKKNQWEWPPVLTC